MILGGMRVLAGGGLALLSGTALAQGLDAGPGTWPTGGETVVVEPFVGYLRGTSTENIYDPTNKKNKVSQLDWNVQAPTVGGRVAFRPFDGLTVRGHVWTAIAGDGNMRDRDWLWTDGYQGASSWTHESLHPNTKVPKAWQADTSLSYTLIDAGDVAVTGIAGYRHYNVKYKAVGGTYLYSDYSWRDTTGVFPNVMGGSYEQWWDTPYLGVGAYYRSSDFSLSTEIYGSPVTFVRSSDFHALRSLNFQSNFTPAGMVGANIGIEYRVTPMFSLVGRLDYTRYIEARGNLKIYDYANGTSDRYRKPISGADADTLNLSLGVKARL